MKILILDLLKLACSAIRIRPAAWLCATLAATVPTTELAAHATGENYIFIDVAETMITGRFEIHFDDLANKIGIKADLDDMDAAVKTINETAPEVRQYIVDRFSLGPANGDPYHLQFTRQDVVDAYFAKFAQYFFEIPIAEIPDKLVVRHEMLYENDRFHRGLLVVTGNAKTGDEYPPEQAAMVFSRPTSRQELDLTKSIEGLMPSKAFIWQGILHIWIGIDHILFLIVLLLPAVLRRENGQWLPTESFGKAAWNIIKIVTIFTIAHTITLSLAALDFISLPGRLIESVIAASIILVGANNLFPRFKEGSALLIFFFGLFHGMGFASVMGELPFRIGQLVKVLICFNVGVELGQLAIVVSVFLILFALRRTAAYRPVFLYGGSVAASLVGLFWLVERAFAL